jgi:formylglycine-generating enzyme required for sulfatase activity/CheY-like chemotaxis protein
MRILLVDDDAGVVQALLAILQGLPGHEVRSAATGEEALAAAAELGGVDLLITDVVMEPMDGFTLRDHLITLYPAVRTILISGYDLSDYPEQTKHHQLLAKPIDAETLRTAVAKELPPAPAPVPEPPAAPAPPAAPVAVPVARPTVVARAVPAPAAQPVARPPGVPVASPSQPAVTMKATAVPRPSAVAPSPVAVARPTTPSAPPNQPTVTARPTAVPRPSGVTPSPAAPAPPSAPSASSAPAPVHHPTVRVAATIKARPVPPPSAPGAVPKASGVRPASAVAPGTPVAVPKASVAPATPAPSPVARSVPIATPAPRSGAVQTQAVTPAPAPRPSAVAMPTVVAAPIAPSGISPMSFPAPTSAESEDLSGQSFGAYQILRKLGEGRWGGIYAGLQTSINRPVALEVLDTAKAADPVAQGRFVADARAKAGVQHPSILAVYEAGEAEGRFFYAYEHVDGQNLAELKNSEQRLDEPTTLKVLRVVADGLAYFSAHHTPHTTPEAANIFVGVDGQPRLANLATQLADQQLAPAQEIQAVGRIMLSALPAIQSLSLGLRELLKRMVQPGPQAFNSWGQLLQAVKAIEPKVVPVEAAKISAQDRAAIAAVEQARKQQKRSLYYNLASLVTLVLLIAGFAFWFFYSNERALDEQVEIPAGDFLFANAQSKNLPVYWIDKYEVTYGQYSKFVEFLKGHPTTEYDHPQQPRIKSQMMHMPEHWEIFYGRAKAGQPVHATRIDLNCPVMEVDFWDAYAYAKWKGRELPTEEEWEKAARGTKGFIYPWGDEFDPKKVNSNADYDADHPEAKGKVDGYNFWNPVDKIKGDKSPFGVIGMAGNVREWTATWDAAKHKPIVKGGSFMSSDVRLDQRAETIDPSAVSEAIGFRTVSHTPPVKK